MIVLDASVLIGLADSRDASHHAAVSLLGAVADEQWGASVLTVAEFLVGPARHGGPTLQRARDLLTDLEIHQISLTEGDAESLARVRSATSLRMPDCCVLVAAETTSSSIATFDTALARAARSRGLVVHDGTAPTASPPS